jgi:hypothetical protein
LIISSDKICHICIEFGKTFGNHTNFIFANLDAILLTNQGTVSDSCKRISLPQKYAAITIGNATYHHLQKILSILCFLIIKID